MQSNAVQRRAPRVYAALLGLLGFILTLGGGYLTSLGGSPYYLLAGLILLGCCWLLWRGDARGAWLYGLLTLATILWALREIGWQPWALVPRVLALSIVGLWLLLPRTRRRLTWPDTSLRRPKFGVALTVALALIAISALLTRPPIVHPVAFSAPGSVRGLGPDPSDASEWHAYAKDDDGNRFVTATQITPANVGQLELAWTFRSGDLPLQRYTFEATPLKIGDSLIFCTPSRQVIALDAETGRLIWRFVPTPDLEPGQTGQYCRGVSYHESNNVTGACSRRILATTRDGKLWALDAGTGKPCADFGENGVISQFDGLGPMKARDTFTTSPGVVIGDRIVLGAFVVDAKSVNVPSGVIRAYDVRSGALSWAWDMGSPDRIGAPVTGETYTPSTPNAWAPLSADAELGLVYVPTGNPAPDFYGAHRRPFDEKYGSSLVALDAQTGRPRWSFQAVHHDIWDLDMPAQPILVSVPTADGATPAVVQLSKTGDIYVLDRRTGTPILPVRETSVPQSGAIPEEHLSATQPASVASLAPQPLREHDMWGLTPIDQMLCRIRYRQSRYDGMYTPPGTTLAIGFPASSGVISWGSGAVDPTRGVLIVNTSYMPFMTRLVAREKDAVESNAPVVDYRISEMSGTPYRYFTEPMLSPIDLPCKQPPWGILAAIDLRSGATLWRSVLGTTRANGPFNLPALIPVPIGTPNIGGNVITSAGLSFIGAATDRYLRAFEVATGRELWRASLPASAHASPMTYTARSGRQFVVVAAGGHALLPGAQGDYLLAFALPHPER